MSIIEHSSPLARGLGHRIHLWLLGILLPVLACELDPASVVTPGKTVATHAEERGPGHAFYPLTIGNRWEYRGRSCMLRVIDGSDPIEEFAWTSEVARELVGVKELRGREYVIERETGFQSSPFGDQSWVYLSFMRQDRSGLYSADSLIVMPREKAQATDRNGTIPGRDAAFAAAFRRIESRRARVLALLGRFPLAGVNPDELTLLQYPLHTGARWRVRNDPDLVIEALVEGHEVLELPAGRFPAWRVRILWQIDDPLMDIRLWYGTSGFLQMVIRDDVEEVPDWPGTLVYEESQILSAFAVDRSRGRDEPTPAHP